MESLVTAFGWSSPIGLGIFVVSVAATLFFLSKTIQTLSTIDREINPKK